MASYFDEHDCHPLADGQQPDHLMHFARLLVDTGHWSQADFSAHFTSTPPPPTSRKFIDGLEEAENSQGTFQCPICLRDVSRSDKVCQLPCRHQFHKGCIRKWMDKTSTCPLCRFELPTDDYNYEEMKRQRKREEQRKHDIENLHDSMFG